MSSTLFAVARMIPAATAAEYAMLARQYRCTFVTGDNFAQEWVAGAYRTAGVEYRRSPRVRSELYLEGLPVFTRGLVRIPDHPQLLRELRLLERRTARSGKDSVDHGVGGSDDYANSLFGALYLVAKRPDVLMGAWPILVSAPRTNFGDFNGGTDTDAAHSALFGIPPG